DNGGETPMKFLIDVEIDYTASGNEANSAKINKKVPVLVIGKRFLSQFVSLYVDDSVFVTRLNPATLYVDGSKAEPVFTTTDMSEIIKVNGLECLDDIHTRLSCSPQTTFTQESQEALLYSVSSDGPKDATGNSSNNASLTHSPQHHNAVSQGSRSQARHFSGDNHLLVNKGRLESYSGEITSIVDFTLGIYVIDGVHLLVLSYWPLLSPLLLLRKGTRVVIDNVHIILLSNSACYSWQWFDKIPHLQQHAGVDDDKRRVLVFGACSRSSIRILEFPTSDAPSNLPCILNRSIIAEVVGRSSDHPKANAAPCNLCTEFLSHSNCCSVDSSVVAEPLRVVTLRTIIQRFVSWQNSQSDTDAGSRNDSTNEHYPDHQAKGDIGEVQVVKIYLSSLQLEKIPIIGRVVVSDRGSICIQDSTGTIRILPNFRPKEDHASTIYPSQQHIGHVYVWKSWYFINESVDVAAVLGKGGRPLGMQLVPEGSVFSLVYASVSDSLVLYTDDTFGGMVPTTPTSAPEMLDLGAVDEKNLDDCSYGDRMFDVPVLVAQAASEHAFDRLKSSTIYSVRDILSPVTGCFKTLVVLQDHGDATHEILLYIKLKSFSHPAGIVPGAHASVRNVTLGVSRSTGKPYLTATAVTNIQALLRHEMPSFCDGFSDDTDAESIVIPFIGQLYTQQRFQHRKISLSGCYIDNVFSIQIMVICATCGQAVCNMQCCCGTKSARALKELPSEPRARGGMYADVSMTAHVSDGSGIALICASGADALCEVLQISPENMEALYRASAQALDGKLVWRQQRWAPDEANQLSEEQGMLGFMVAAAARTAIICIEGVLQSVEMPADEAACSVVKQTVRLGGQDIVVNRYATVTVATRRVVRIAVADLCWKMLGEL
ncbi:hypothetical protein EV175_004109, partial [Coemansia sp. RSA 1933]